MAKQSELEQLQDQVAKLQRQLGQLTGEYPKPDEPDEQTDYVERGSDRHAGMLGLKKASAEDKPQVDGWALEDIVSYGPTVTPEFLDQLLQQKVNELTTEPPEMQSEDPLAQFFAPTIWQPGQRLAQLTE